MHIVECDSDVVLVSELASISRKNIMHAYGKHRVLRRLIYKDTDSIGIVDQDPLRPQPVKFLQRFSRNQYFSAHKLEILRYEKRSNSLIMLYPKLEDWVLEAAKSSGIRLRNYNLPSNPDELHEIINFKLNRFRQLVHDLKQSSERIRILQSYL